MEYFGIDVHSKYSEICGLSEEGEVTVRRRIPTTETALKRFFGPRERAKVTLESGPVTPPIWRTDSGRVRSSSALLLTTSPCFT